MFTSFSQYLTLVFPIVTIFCLVLFFKYYLRVTLPLKGTTEWNIEDRQQAGIYPPTPPAPYRAA